MAAALARRSPRQRRSRRNNNSGGSAAAAMAAARQRKKKKSGNGIESAWRRNSGMARNGKRNKIKQRRGENRHRVISGAAARHRVARQAWL
jgi:hypothetical protein